LYKGRRANPHRLHDLADVQELITYLNLPLELHEQLDPSVRAEYTRQIRLSVVQSIR